ncbi:MAG: aromatic ring-hydroxylating dioxygenase subunit alpha, partial [Anderseniella sp.]|nr:aromatic ring-hydroxylating dioxygenase subunit alpha [Anderseniella sp.]
MALQDALGKLQDTAASPLDEAFSSPPEIYTNPEMLKLELRELFEREWHCPGLAADIPEPGDYVTFSIGDQPVFCIRQKDGAIRSFSNVCRHRMMQLLEGSGNTRTIVCPYHAWTYGQDGSLRGASQMDRSQVFNRQDFCLPEIRTEIWNGWIYITLNQDAAPVAQLLAPMNDLVAQFRMDRYVPCETQDHVWQTNWKLLTENFMEGYHLPVAHKATVGQWIGLDDTVFPDKVSPHFTWQTFTKGETATYGLAADANDYLEGRWRHTTIMPTVFPAHMYVLAPDHVWYLSLRPKGVGEVHVRFGVALAPER